MSEANLDRVKQIFHRVMEAAEPEREKLLHALCGDDGSLREQVESLLAADQAGSDLLNSRELDEANAVHAAAEAESESMIEGPGSKIGPYKLLQVIGEGGFGVVYMAEQEAPIRRRVALKVVKPGMDTKQVIARFEAERQALAILDHPNIAKVFEAGTTPTGRPYFVMELVRGIPITEYCDEERLDTKERLALFAEVCSAVNHAHQHGIIHRDIKPSNVLVTLHDGTPVPMVIDFGIAKATHQRLTDRTLFTEFNQFIGTPAYMAPEQAAYEGLDVDARSDVYSLGVLLYELLTGTTPFDATLMKRAAYQEVLRILKEEEPPKPSTRVITLGEASATNASLRRLDRDGLVRLLRGDLDWIVMKALEKDRRRRYESTTDLADDITRYFSHQPVLARRPSRVYRARKLFRRRRGPFMAAAVVVLALVADVAYVSWARLQGSARAETGVVPAAIETGGPVARMLLNPRENPADRGYDNPRVIIPSPDGHRIAYLQSGPERNGIHIRDLATDAAEEVASGGQTEEFMPPVWSSDAKRLAFTVQDTVRKTSIIKILDLTTRAARTIPVPVEGKAYLVDWTRDGRSFLFNDMEAQALRILAVDDGSVTTVSDGVWPWQRASFSPDGRFVVYGYGGALGARPVCVQPVTGGPRHEIAQAGDGLYPHPMWSPDGSAIAYQDTDGIWVVPMADGMPSGPERLAYRTASLFWGASWTAAGGVHFTSFQQHNGPWRVEVDPSTGRAAGSGAEELTEYPGLILFRWSPDGRRVALNGWSYRDLTVYSLDTKARTPFRDLEQDGGVRLPFWSPDGNELWYEHSLPSDESGRTVKAIDLATGQVRELFTVINGGGVSFSADGRTMAFVRGRSESGPVDIVVAAAGEADGRVVARLPDPDGSQVHRRVMPQLSPQGDQVFYAVREPPGRGSPTEAIWVVGADGAGARRVTTAVGILSATWDPGGRLIAYTVRMPDGTGSVLRVVEVSTGEDHEVSVPNDDHLLMVTDWSRDGRFIGYVRLETWWEYWAVQGLVNDER